MKIASIYRFNAYPPKGGNHVHAYQLIRRFQAEGHEVLTWADDSVPGVRSFPGTADGLDALQAEADVLYVRFDANQLRRDPVLAGFLARNAKPMVWEINAPANENLAFSWLGGDATDSRDGDSFLRGVRRRAHAWRQLPAILLEERLRRKLAGRVSAATCVSECVAEYARIGLGIAEVHVVPNAADHEAHRPDGPKAALPAAFDGCLKVMYAGSPIYPWQGLDVLERTIDLCAEAGDPIRFVLLMNQQGPRRIDSSNAACFFKVPHEQVGDYLRAVDVAVVIHPEFFWSRWGSHGSPMKLFDYMACGRPVVASNVGQLAEVIMPGRNGLLFDNTAEDLRRRLLELRSGRHDLAAMGAAARGDVETRYNWHVIGRETLAILEAARARGL